MAPARKTTLLAFVLLAAARAEPSEVFVDPEHGSDDASGDRSAPLRTVHAARDAVRRILSASPSADVAVQLLPGVHHIGDGPLELGPEDGGAAGRWVTWRSADAAAPAVLGAPVAVRGWTQHASNDRALSAPVPEAIAKGSKLRQFWVNGIRAERPRIYGHGRQPGDNKEGFCLNLTNASSTSMYPEGSAFDFSHENATDPSTWSNPEDVEFIYTSCDAINCWIEPRCTVESVDGQVVKLKQGDNSSCYHRLYYYSQCFDNGKGPGRTGLRGRNPTSLENVEANFTQPGQWYYDRAAGRIGYIPRDGETAATLEASATTATAEELLVFQGAANVRWQNVRFEYATWLGASGPKGYIDTQSAYLCQDGEPPVNVKIEKSRNITFSGCSFEHLGGVYAVGADGGSQDVVVSNCSFLDISGGGVKLGYSGERGAPPPAKDLDSELQDRGFLVSDNFMNGIPAEYSGANPIFAGYVADTDLVHNTINNSRYSGICAGWGWGLESYMRNVHINNNSITHPMQLLHDGGGVYTNTPCPHCTVSRNYMAYDPHVYGTLYHDGGSSLWTDKDNVFNHIQTSAVFCHGSCPGISMSPIYYNDSDKPNMQGATNFKLHDKDGVCVKPLIVQVHGESWPDAAAEIVKNAGRRSGDLGALTPPPLSPPVNDTENHEAEVSCIRFKARKCVASKDSQRWFLSQGVRPGDARPTSVKSAVQKNASCWQANNCGYGNEMTCDAEMNGQYEPVKYPDGCKPLPPDASPADTCAHSQAFRFNANGTVALAHEQTDRGDYMHHCLQLNSDHSVGLGDCQPAGVGAAASQIWEFLPNDDGSVTIRQDDLCVDDNYRPEPAGTSLFERFVV